jgi:hypothetical protein
VGAPAWTCADKDTTRLPLFDRPERPPQERAFLAFHRANPHVLGLVIRLARDLKANGVRQGAIDLVFEDLRRLHPVETTGEGWRLNNSYRAYYARTAMHRAPDLAGYFEVRRQRVPFDPKSVE